MFVLVMKMVVSGHLLTLTPTHSALLASALTVLKALLTHLCRVRSSVQKQAENMVSVLRTVCRLLSGMLSISSSPPLAITGES